MRAGVCVSLVSISFSSLVVLDAKHDEEGQGEDAQNASHGSHDSVLKPDGHIGHCLSLLIMPCRTFIICMSYLQ